ncbi:hypothetical protein ACI2WT_18180 [Lysinibacillus fusiformis]
MEHQTNVSSRKLYAKAGAMKKEWRIVKANKSPSVLLYKAVLVPTLRL